MVSKNYKNWLSVEDERRCVACEEKHGKIHDINEIPNPEPPLHDHCRCAIVIMKAVTAGEATSKGKNGADWWLANYQNLPPYYLTEKQAKALGWKPKRGNLSVVAPGRMVAMGEYGNRDGHLPAEDGRIWFEADIDYVSGWRNDHRIVFSDDGLIFVSYDHYQTFIEIVSEGIKK